MLMKLTCSGCHSPVEAEEADRGKTVRCGICWGEVPVPSAGSGPVSAKVAKPTGSGPVPTPAAKPVTAKPAVVAKATPVVAKPASVAKVAAVATVPPSLPPVEETTKTKPVVDDGLDYILDDEDEFEAPTTPKPVKSAKASSSKRDRDPDEKPAPAKKGSPILKLLLIGGGVMFFLSVAVVGTVGYFIYKGYESAKNAVNQIDQQIEDDLKKSLATNTSSPATFPNFAEDPFNLKKEKSTGKAAPKPKPKDTKPAWKLTWEPISQGNSFSVNMPPNVKVTPINSFMDEEILSGQQYISTEAHVAYRLDYLDLPVELKVTAQEFPKRYFEPSSAKRPSDRGKPITLGGLNGTEHIIRNGNVNHVIRSVKIGPRIFMLSTMRSTRSDGDYPSFNYDTVAREFFDSVKFSYDANTPPPRSRNPKSNSPPTQNNPVAIAPMPPRPSPFPPNPRPFDPPIGPPPMGNNGNTGNPDAKTPKLVTKLDMHYTGLYLPERRQLLTLAPTPTRTTLRLVSIETFKTMMSLDLPTNFQHLVVDEKNKRLYLAGGPYNGPIDTMTGTNQKTDLHVYDLEKLFSPMGGAGQPKPLLTRSIEAKIMGLQLSPNGKTLYLGLNKPGPKTGAKGRYYLEKVDSSTLVKQAETDLAQPVYGLRLSPDGKTLMAYLHPYNNFGFTVFGSTLTASVEILNSTTLSKPLQANVQGLVSDLQFVSDEKAVAVVMVGQQSKLFSISTKGETQDITPVVGAPRAQGGGHLAVDIGTLPGAYRLVVSSRIGSGVDIYHLPQEGAAGAKQVGSAIVLPGGLLSGQVVILPGGKNVVLGHGATLDLTGIE